jgi:hypothetical protein
MGSAVRLVRLVQFGLIASIVLYVAAGEFVRHKPAADSGVFYALSFVAISIVGATLVVRRTLVLPSEALLHQKPDDSLTFARWRSGYLIMYAMCETLATLGLVLRLLGYGFSQVWGFYLGGFALLLLFSPRAPRPEFK